MAQRIEPVWISILRDCGDLERRFDLQLTKPDPREACVVLEEPMDLPTGLDADLVATRHRMMTDLMLMAVACDQTRVFNMFYASAFSATTQPGYDKPHHTATHEEAVDPELGYQPYTSWYTRRAMEEWAYYVQALASFKEGDGSCWTIRSYMPQLINLLPSCTQ